MSSVRKAVIHVSSSEMVNARVAQRRGLEGAFRARDQLKAQLAAELATEAKSKGEVEVVRDRRVAST